MDAIQFLKQEQGAFSFAKALKGYRSREGITQQQLATQLNVSKSYVSDLENQRRFVSVEQAVAFAQKLGESSKCFAEWALQDQVNKAGLNMQVHLDAA